MPRIPAGPYFSRVLQSVEAVRCSRYLNSSWAVMRCNYSSTKGDSHEYDDYNGDGDDDDTEHVQHEEDAHEAS